MTLGVGGKIPNARFRKVLVERAQLSDNPLCPISIEWGKESDVVRRAWTLCPGSLIDTYSEAEDNPQSSGI
jgi:hypothetical protein